jgi:hypothetical protein
VRFDSNTSLGFDDRATFSVVNRNLPVPAFTVTQLNASAVPGAVCTHFVSAHSFSYACVVRALTEPPLTDAFMIESEQCKPNGDTVTPFPPSDLRAVNIAAGQGKPGQTTAGFSVRSTALFLLRTATSQALGKNGLGCFIISERVLSVDFIALWSGTDSHQSFRFVRLSNESVVDA